MRTLVFCLLATAGIAAAQDNPFTSFNKHMFGTIKTLLVRSAEKMPADDYAFRPTDSVRSFGQLVGHIADSQYYFCSAALGEKNPALNIEKNKSKKADLIAALKDALAYCDKAYDNSTDADARQMVKVMGETPMPKPLALTTNDVHDVEHSGNMVTYLRMKNIVPPSSESEGPAKK